jgi:cytochrome c oxidase subunit III
MSTGKSRALPKQFDDADQQRESASLGMWVFIGSEVMFFGGLFLALTVYRYSYPAVFEDASRHLDVLAGSLNSGILLTSSLTLTFGISSLKNGSRFLTVCFLTLTMLLGLLFLVIKGFEYHHEWELGLVPGAHFEIADVPSHLAELFFLLYFLMTGVHALHLVIGLGVIGTVIILVLLNKVNKERYLPAEVGSMYWHFVDIVWIFVFPSLYLIRG